MALQMQPLKMAAMARVHKHSKTDDGMSLSLRLRLKLSSSVSAAATQRLGTANGRLSERGRGEIEKEMRTIRPKLPSLETCQHPANWRRPTALEPQSQTSQARDIIGMCERACAS
jgi:hypothetical protein